MHVSAVVPVYGNASTVEELHRRLRAALADAAPFEILFVDDACPRGSLPVLRRLADADPAVGVIALARNVGQNRAVLAGIARSRGDVVVVLDADLQDPPEAIPSLLAALRTSRAAAVFGGRRGRYESRGRLVTSRLWKRALRLLGRRRLPADAGLFVAMSRALADRVVATAGGDAYVLALMARTGLPLTSIPVDRAPRASGSSAYSGAMRLRTAWRGLRTTFTRPGDAAPPPPVAELVGAPFRTPAPAGDPR